jgi:H+/Cl- antiporter ClcA
MLLNDPVVLISMIGLGILFGICGYYVYYFVKHIQEADKK